MIPEVAVYIKNFKNFLDKNEEARLYFLSNVNEELFFEHLEDIANKNFEKQGDPLLSRDQLELLRKTMQAIQIMKKPEEELYTNGVFAEIPNFGFICLN
jgi:hypothetical protein